jgi:hypothetical protein
MGAQNITVNISLAGEIDMDKIRQEFDKAVRTEIDRVGFNVEFGAKNEPLKVGDYAKVFGFEGSKSGYNGIIVSLTKSWGNEEPDRFNVKPIADSPMASCSTKNLVKATDEEVAEAKRQQAEELERKELERKWAKIGRKPNEFKKGDIVRGERATSPTNETAVGEIEDVGSEHERCHGVRTFINEKYFAVLKDTAELVTPVEHRFDIGGDAE